MEDSIAHIWGNKNSKPRCFEQIDQVISLLTMILNAIFLTLYMKSVDI